MAILLDGKRVRDEILGELRPRVADLAARGVRPGLAVVLVGDNPASHLYVRNKVQACAELSIHSETITPPDNIATAALLDLIAGLNARPDIDGILVQMPLPPHIDARAVLLAIDPAKDVDGFHPCNSGAMLAGLDAPQPCTPSGIIEMLKRYRIPIAGRHAVVVGRSDIVGKPMAILLLREHATVTVCHSRTPDLAQFTRQADILVAAIGRPMFVRGDMIRPGAVVIDVGMNRIDDPNQAALLLSGAPSKHALFAKNGTVVVGDVHPDEALAVASAFTPVPGGVGPLTIAMLMSNTVQAAGKRVV